MTAKTERKEIIRALTRYYSEDFYGGIVPWIEAARRAIAEVRETEGKGV